MALNKAFRDTASSIWRLPRHRPITFEAHRQELNGQRLNGQRLNGQRVSHYVSLTKPSRKPLNGLSVCAATPYPCAARLSNAELMPIPVKPP